MKLGIQTTASLENAFLKTAAVLLLVTGVAKLATPLGGTRVLAVADPILGLSFGKLLPLVGAAEIAVAVACLSSRLGTRLKLGLVAWMAANFLVYRIGLWAVGWHHPCSCMGSLAGALHLSDQTADNAMRIALAYLLTGSCACLMLRVPDNSQPSSAGYADQLLKQS